MSQAGAELGVLESFKRTTATNNIVSDQEGQNRHKFDEDTAGAPQFDSRGGLLAIPG